MAINDLIPWKRKESDRDTEEGSLREEGSLQVRQDPFLTFQERMNRIFDDFFRGTALEPFGASPPSWQAFSPSLDVTETDKEIKVSAELPGLDEQDIDVGLSRNVLTISGEKRQQKEERGQNYLRTERSYGSFRRSVPLPSEVDAGKAGAVFRNGVLSISLPKTEKAQTRKKIQIKTQ